MVRPIPWQFFFFFALFFFALFFFSTQNTSTSLGATKRILSPTVCTFTWHTNTNAYVVEGNSLSQWRWLGVVTEQVGVLIMSVWRQTCVCDGLPGNKTQIDGYGQTRGDRGQWVYSIRSLCVCVCVCLCVCVCVCVSVSVCLCGREGGRNNIYVFMWVHACCCVSVPAGRAPQCLNIMRQQHSSPVRLPARGQPQVNAALPPLTLAQGWMHAREHTHAVTHAHV